MKKLFTLAAACLLFTQNAFAQCTAEILQTGPLATCTGDVFTLNATPGGVTYQWSLNGVPLPGATSDHYDVPATTTNVLTYTVDIDFGTCTDVSDPVTVTVNQTPPTPTATSNSPVCTGQLLMLSANTLPGVSYQWIGPNLTMSPLQFWTISAMPFNAGVYTLNVISTNGCVSDSTYITVQVNNSPVVTATNATSPACPGDNVTLQASTIPGATYTWTGPGAFTAVTQNPVLVNVQPTSAGAYQVMATALNGCTATASTTVTVNPITPPPTVTTPVNYCQYSNAAALTAIGANIMWYTTQVGGTPSPVAPVPSTVAPGVITYYASQTLGSCESLHEPVNVVINPNPVISNVMVTNPNFPANGMITLTGFASNTVYTVSFTQNSSPVTVSITSTVTGQIIITGLGVDTYDDFVVTYNGCSSNSMGPYVLVEQNPGASYMWPGDVNWDFTADNIDVLDLGLAYGQTGTVRVGATNNWSAQVSVDWGIPQISGIDMKHADCNGDGTVDATDQDAITLNYGMIHPKGVHLPQAKSAALPDLYFDLTGITFTAGTTVSIPIKLGTGTLPMNDILGIAAKIKVQNVTLNNAPTVNNTTSWIGNGTNTMNFYKDVNPNQTDWALVRTDHNNVSGDGTIATLVMDIPVGSSGDAILYFEGVKIINNVGDVLTDYNVIDDTATIIPVAINNTENASDKIVIVPNPSEGNADLQLTLSKNTDLQISITDISGREVWKKSITATKGNSNITLPATQLASGIYAIKVKGIDTPAIKWIKK